MSLNQGMTLTEVLIALVLITSASLGLLKQQWQIIQIKNQTQQLGLAISILDNLSEQLLSSGAYEAPKHPFHISSVIQPNQHRLSLSWSMIASHQSIQLERVITRLCDST